MSTPTENYEFWATVIYVVDGDTFDLVIDRGFRDYKGDPEHPVRFRHTGIDTFETALRRNETPEGKVRGIRCRELAREWLTGKRVKVITNKTKPGIFGRYEIEIFLQHDGRFVGWKEVILECGFDRDEHDASNDELYEQKIQEWNELLR